MTMTIVKVSKFLLIMVALQSAHMHGAFAAPALGKGAIKLGGHLGQKRIKISVPKRHMSDQNSADADKAGETGARIFAGVVGGIAGTLAGTVSGLIGGGVVGLPAILTDKKGNLYGGMVQLGCAVGAIGGGLAGAGALGKRKGVLAWISVMGASAGLGFLNR